jgi:hypothetical protein
MIPKGLKDELERWIDEKKYGHLQINFSGGRIMNMNRVESVRVDPVGYITTSFGASTQSTNDPKVSKLE